MRKKFNRYPALLLALLGTSALFISLTAFAGGILNTHGRFGVPAFTPVLLNISLISCALWLAPQMEQPVVALAWGVFIAGLAQFLFQAPFLHQLKLLPRFSFAPRDEGVRRIGRLMVSGSISWLYYSDRLMEFPVGVLGVALGTVILPSLSKKHAADSTEAFSQTLDWGLRWTLLLGLPAAVGLFLLAGPMIATLFQSDVFQASDVMMSRRSLMAYSLGLVPFILIKVLAPGYYSRQDTRTPVRIAVIALAHAGLALATTLSASLNAFLLFQGLRRDAVYRPPAGWRALMARGLIASLLMGGVLYWAAGPVDGWLIADTWARVWRLLGLILLVVGLVCAFF